MASIEHVDVPEIGAGILQPKLIHYFRVKFSSRNEKHDQVLSTSLIAVSSILQSRLTDVGDVQLRFRDDVMGYTSKAIQHLFSSKSFNLTIEHLDANEQVTTTYKLHDCQVAEIEHSDLDYAGRPSPQSFSLDTRNWDGPVIQELRDNPLTSALVTLLNGMKLTFSAPNDFSSSVVEHTLVVHYQQLEIS